MYDQLLRPTTDRTIKHGDRPSDNRVGWRPMVPQIVASCDRSYEHSWHPVTERRIDRGIRRPIRSYDQSWAATIDRTINRSIVRLIVATYDRYYDQSWQSWHQTPIVRSIVVPCERSYDQSCDYRSAIIHNWWCHHARLVVRSRKTYMRPLTIFSRRLEVVNMTIDLVTTDFALTIIHDLCYQSYVLSTTCPRFQYFSGRS